MLNMKLNKVKVKNKNITPTHYNNMRIETQNNPIQISKSKVSGYLFFRTFSK